jgi:glutathione-regulated potassium-efflux system ancillary protein KefC/glutathione-regulated potassium-efflux system protein KefB
MAMDGTLLQVFVYLAAAVIAVPVAKRLGLGSVLGYLIAGVLIGPHLLRLAGDAGDVGHMAEFGVVILLFLIGLEVRPALLWEMRGSIFGLGTAQLLGSAGALMLGGLALGLDWRQALAVGLILAMSSTAIVLQLLEERGLRRGPAGLASFGVLLFQDLAVIPLLAFLPVLAAAGAPAAVSAHAGLLDHYPAWVRGLGVLAAVLAVVIGGRFLIRPVFRWIASTRLREVFTAFSLALVVGVALLMQVVGLSPALGAFLAGVVLAESEFRRELETDIEPFRGLLLGLFFITVGAGLDLPLVLREPLALLGLTAGLMTVKGVAMYLAARAAKLAWRDAGASAVALSQGGEFAFVLLSFAVGAQVLGAQTAGLLTAAIALSMAATPLALAAFERLSRTRAVEAAAPEDNSFDEGEPDAVIAGSGRFGQIVARVLTANGFRISIMDSSIEQIELLRRFGRRVYYGDAGRLDLLRAAGAEKAKILVVAIDDRERTEEIVRMAKEAFPHLKLLARAFDRRAAYSLLDAGADMVERETFESALALSAGSLQSLGWSAARAHKAAKLFRVHDRRLFEKLRPLWGDDERFTIAARESSPVMEELLRQDLQRLSGEMDAEEAESETSTRREVDDLYEKLGREPAAG